MVTSESNLIWSGQKIQSKIQVSNCQTVKMKEEKDRTDMVRL